MTFDEWYGVGFDSTEAATPRDAFTAGAASRDAEIAELVAALECFYNAWAAGRNSVDVAAIRTAKAAIAKVRKP